MNNTTKQIEEILREFLDATDYVLEIADEAPLDDPDFFDRPGTEATQAIEKLIIGAKKEALREERKHRKQIARWRREHFLTKYPIRVINDHHYVRCRHLSDYIEEELKSKLGDSK